MYYRKITAVTLLILYVFSITACSLTIPAEQVEAAGYMNQKYGGCLSLRDNGTRFFTQLSGSVYFVESKKSQ